jgi:hypothetical protein
MTDRFTERTNAFWKQYVGSDDEHFSYQWGKEAVMEAAKKKDDREMQTYLNWLNTYLNDNQIFNGWEYPTRKQIDQRNLHLRQMVNVARKYTGKRLRAQYALLRMRALFGLKQYRQASNFWRSTGRRLPESVYRDMMQNIHAGCQLRLGNRREAVEIYARQQDFVSLKYCVRNYRNLAGIQKVYSENPNSATLTYLVQDFVNNTQETMDLFEDSHTPYGMAMADSDKVKWMKQIDRSIVYRKDAEQFAGFAQQVLKEGKTQSPCLWESAAGCIHYLLGDYATAKKELSAALSMAGTQRMKDNAKAILMVNDAQTEAEDKDFYSLMADHLKWLDKMSAAEQSVYDYLPNHYAQVKNRLVYLNLVPILQQKGQTDLAVALIGTENKDAYDNQDWPLPYNNDYYEALQKFSPDQLASYFETIKNNADNPLKSYAYGQVTANDDYYNDLIGTKYLANGQFQEAIPYLEKVSLTFLSKQAIAPYAARKDWNVERWMTKQKMPKDFYDGSASNSVALTTNKKLDFCREMLRQESLYRNMREGLERREQAYKLASLYYQASYEGDCWWLTQYGVSVSQDSTLAGTKDFVAQAINLLEPLGQPYSLSLMLAQAPNKKAAKALKKAFKAKYGKDGNAQFDKEVLNLRQKSLYALAFIHRDPWYFYGWDSKTEQWYDLKNLRVNKSSRQYLALQALSTFAAENPADVAPYVSRCDVLKRFLRSQ